MSKFSDNLMTKIAACGKRKGSKQNKRSIKMSDIAKTAALLCAYGTIEKTAGDVKAALSDMGTGFSNTMQNAVDKLKEGYEAAKNRPGKISDFIRANAGALGTAAGRSAIEGTLYGSLAYTLAKILKAKHAGAIGAGTGLTAAAFSAGSDLERIKAADKLKRPFAYLRKDLFKNIK